MSPTSVGTAAPGWPTSGATLDADRLHVVSRNLDRTRVAEIDIDAMAVVRQRTIGAGDGAWGLTTAPDGVYVGLFGARGSGNLYRLTGASSSAVAALAVDYLWDLAAGDDGSVVGVGGNPGLVFRYDPATRRATDLGILTTRQRPRTCAAVGSRVVVGGKDDDRAFLVDRVATGGAVRSLLPVALRTDDTVYCSAVTGDGQIAVGTAGRDLDRPAIAVIPPGRPDDALVARLPREALVDTVACDGQAVYATARPSGAIYRLDGATGQLTRLAVPVPMSETRLLEVVDGDLIGVSADGSAWRHDVASGETRVVTVDDLGLVRRPQRGQSICAGADRVDVGGSFSMTRHRPAAGTATTRFVPGEPKAMVDVDGTTWFAVYPIGEVWAWPADADAPHRVTQLDSDQLRPVAMAHLAQLDALVCTTTDDLRRSLLNTIDPVTGRVDAVVNPLGGEVLAGVTTAGTTIYVGGSGSRPSVAAFDAVSGARLWTVADVIPQGGFLLGLQVIGPRLLVSSSRGWVATIDLASRAVAAPVRVAQAGGQLRRTGSRALLATGDRLLRIDPVDRSATTVESGLDGQFWNWPPMDVDPAGRAWLLRGRDLVHT